MKKTTNILFIIFISFFIFVSCENGQTQQKTTNNSQSTLKRHIDKVFSQFSKSKFINQLNKRKEHCDKMVRKSKEYQTLLPNEQLLTSLYRETQVSFNEVIDKMINDINNTSNIMSLAAIRPDSAYGTGFRNADLKRQKFVNEANRQFNQINKPNYEQTNFLMTVAAELLVWGLKEIHNTYHEYLKRKLTNELKSIKFLSWEQI